MTFDVDSNEALLQFLYRAPIGLVQTTIDGQVEMLNPMSAQLLMPITPSGDLDNLFDVLGAVVPQLRGLVGAVDRDSGVVCDALRFRVDGVLRGGPRTYELGVMKVAAGRLMASLVDATADVRREEAAVSERLHQAARVDTLTRMPNRVAIAESMEAALTTTHLMAGRVAILMIGCERLAEIGESFGDEVRDELVGTMAQRLRSVLRRVGPDESAADDGSIAARIGGDEFVVLLQQLADPGDALLVADRMIDALSRSYLIGPHQLHCAVSIGIVHGDDGIGPDDAMRDAAIALREAKRLGGSRWIEFDVAMRDRAVRRGVVEMDLRRALVRDELFVVYQPIVHLRAGRGTTRVAGVEALVRWRHPVRGVVPPIEFIGVAEETGLIGALGRFVLASACRQFAAWSDQFGARAPWLLAVNLSRAQLADPTLLETVRSALATSGLAAERLQLEVTESLAAQDDGVQAQLHALKALGIKLALDDFGTGYSSLSSLHLLPVDTVKIDRSFVTLAETSAHHRVLIEATILVAKSLRMTTVAEGLETDGQIAIVTELGCDKGQGYRFARPLGVDELASWVAGH